MTKSGVNLASKTQPVNPAKRVKRAKSSGIMSMQKKAFWWIMVPYIIFTVVIKAFPIVWSMYMSFTNFAITNMSTLRFIGFENYRRVFTDTEAIASILRTLGFAVIVVPLTNIVCLIFSLLLNRSIKGISVYRTLFYLPSIIPAVAVGMMWRAMYTKSGGLVNAILGVFGVSAINWFDFQHAPTALMIMLMWGAGGGALSQIAALKCIPNELYEAADIEGAGFWRKTFRITLPLTSNMIYMNLVTGIIGMLQLFAQPVLLSGGGMTGVPVRPIYTYVIHIYQQIFANLRFGYGLALVWVIFIIIISFTLITEHMSKYFVYTEVD